MGGLRLGELDDGARLPLDPSQAATFIGGLVQRCWAQEPSDRPTFATIEQDLGEKIRNEKATFS